MGKSLQKQNHELANPLFQLRVISNPKGTNKGDLPKFSDILKQYALFPLKPAGIDILQINLGKMCNQTCKHCHVDAGPDRKEIMNRETLELCLNVIKNFEVKTVDLTGGAPEMNPHFRWFVEEVSKLEKHIIVRCNLTIILANKKYHDLPDFFKKHKVEVVSSLPSYIERKTDRQRGQGVFNKSIKALQMLNAVGYGTESNLQLNLVYNPAGAFLASDQIGLEKQYKEELSAKFGIQFNQLFTITNMPISRFLEFLLRTGNYEKYMQKLVDSFNPMAAENVMCRNMISVSWDGFLYDCDFNQMLDLKISSKKTHISDFNAEEVLNRNIVLNQHCYGCTAGAGSSCGGEIA